MNKKTKIIIGLSGWSYDEWHGSFYPNNIAKRKWLEYYATKFKAVEINATFYRTFPETTFLKWYERAPKHFYYVVKASKLITHQNITAKHLHAINKLEQDVSLLNEKGGLILLQFPAKKIYALEPLHKLLSLFKQPKKVVIEFRHPKWLTAQTITVLKKLGCIYCITDSPLFHFKDNSFVTADTVYIRMHGRRYWYHDEYTVREIKELAEFIVKLTKNYPKITNIFIFFNNTANAYAIYNALQLQQHFFLN